MRKLQLSGVSTSLPSILVHTYDPTGYERVQFEICPGDVLEYKRNGFRGFRKGTVLEIVSKKKPLKIQPVDRDGSPSGPPIYRNTGGIVHAWRAGGLLGVPDPFDGKVLQYADGDQNRFNGWLSVERGGGRRNVEFNNHSPGWPPRSLRVGEIVRCEMRPAEGYPMPVWFVIPLAPA